MEGIELPNQERIRMRGEKAILKYLRILEADTVKQVEIKQKKNNKKQNKQTSISDERDDLKPSSAARISLKG